MLLYIDPVRHWPQLRPIFETEEVQKLIALEMLDYTMRSDYAKQILTNLLPEDPAKWRPHLIDNCDWRCGRRPAGYHDYVCHGWCHWGARVNLLVANRWRPKKDWRMVHSQKHATVYDGEGNLFDMQFAALRVPTAECWKLATTRGRKDVRLGDPKANHWYGGHGWTLKRFGLTKAFSYIYGDGPRP
jgi:hypothetical protein